MSTFLTDIAKVLKTDPKTGDKSFYGVIKEKVTEGSTVTGYKVSIGGDEDIVEARKMAGAEVGDTVLCTLLSNGSVVVSGRKDGDKDAKDAKDIAEIADGNAGVAKEMAEDAQSAAETAQSAAESAQSAVEMVESHFWTDENGVHVTQNESSTTGKNVLINANGMIIANGNPATASNQLAAFGASKIELGKNSTSSVIEMCGGKFIIKNTTRSGFNEIELKPATSQMGTAITIYSSDGNSYITVWDDGIEIKGSGCTFSSDVSGSAWISDVDINAPNIPSGTILTSSNYYSYSSFSGIISGTGLEISAHLKVSNIGSSSSGTNVIYNGSGYIVKKKSSSNDREIVQPNAPTDYSDLYNIEIPYWKDKDEIKKLQSNNSDKEASVHYGISVEDIENIIPEAVIFDNGVPISFDSDTLLSVLLKLIQDQHKEIEELKERVSALENK